MFRNDFTRDARCMRNTSLTEAIYWSNMSRLPLEFQMTHTKGLMTWIHHSTKTKQRWDDAQPFWQMLSVDGCFGVDKKFQQNKRKHKHNSFAFNWKMDRMFVKGWWLFKQPITWKSPRSLFWTQKKKYISGNSLKNRFSSEWPYSKITFKWNECKSGQNEYNNQTKQFANVWTIERLNGSGKV